MWKIIGICIAALTLSVSASLASLQAAEQGTETGGMAGFHGKAPAQPGSSSTRQGYKARLPAVGNAWQPGTRAGTSARSHLGT